MDTIINNINEQVKQLFSCDYSGHDYSHTERVYRNAMQIAEEVLCDKEIVALAALLHDVDDPKLFHTENNSNAVEIMTTAGISSETIVRVTEIINTVSFKGTDTEIPATVEGKIVQDSDRLDALGAIGIARAFAYGGSRQREMYNPDIPPMTDMDETQYLNSQGTTINHFYEKLLLLKDMMNTDYARALAEERTEYMRTFLSEFMSEWNGEK